MIEKRFGRGRCIAEGHAVRQLRVGKVRHVEQRHLRLQLAAVGLVRIATQAEHKRSVEHLQIIGEARNLQFSLQTRLGRIRQVDRQQRINPPAAVGAERDHKGALAQKPNAVQLLGRSQVLQLADKRQRLAHLIQHVQGTLRVRLPAALRDDSQLAALLVQRERVQHLSGNSPRCDERNPAVLRVQRKLVDLARQRRRGPVGRHHVQTLRRHVHGARRTDRRTGRGHDGRHVGAHVQGGDRHELAVLTAQRPIGRLGRTQPTRTDRLAGGVRKGVVRQHQIQHLIADPLPILLACLVDPARAAGVRSRPREDADRRLVGPRRQTPRFVRARQDRIRIRGDHLRRRQLELVAGDQKNRIADHPRVDVTALDLQAADQFGRFGRRHVVDRHQELRLASPGATGQRRVAGDHRHWIAEDRGILGDHRQPILAQVQRRGGPLSAQPR